MRFLNLARLQHMLWNLFEVLIINLKFYITNWYVASGLKRVYNWKKFWIKKILFNKLLLTTNKFSHNFKFEKKCFEHCVLSKKPHENLWLQENKIGKENKWYTNTKVHINLYFIA